MYIFFSQSYRVIGFIGMCMGSVASFTFFLREDLGFKMTNGKEDRTNFRSTSNSKGSLKWMNIFPQPLWPGFCEKINCRNKTLY